MFDMDNGMFSSPIFLICFLVSAVFSFCEWKFRRKWLFIAANGLLTAVSFALLLWRGAGLADVLLYLLAVIAVRLSFALFEGRTAK